MIALVRRATLEADNKARIEYGLMSNLQPAFKFVKDSAGQRHKVYVDYIFDVNNDHAVTRRGIKTGLEKEWANPRFKTESDWQNKKVEEFVLVDGSNK
jgi:hypothetical protein